MSGSSPSLRELIDIEELQSIQDSFARAVGISSVILSPEGEPLTKFTNPTGFCSLIQSTEKGKERCFQSFVEMGEIALRSETAEILYCFAHGGHFVAPIIIDGEHKGTMFAGQFIHEKFSSEQLHDLEEIAPEIDIDQGALVKEAGKMRVVGEDVIRNYSGLLFKIVETIVRRGVQAAELSRVNDALQRAHDGLEKRVQERTAELAEANRGLEQEVAERKLTEDALRATEERFRMMFESMSDAVAVYDAVDGGKNFIFKDFNQSAEKMDGVKKEDLIGKSVLDAFSGVVDFGLFNVFQRVWQTGEPERPPVSFYKDEKIAAWRENYIYKLPSGEIVAIYEDVTARKAAEEALKKAATVLDAMVEGVTITDMQGKIISINKATTRQLGYTEEEVTGKTQGELFIAESDLPKFFETVEKMRSGRSIDYSEFIAKRKDGTEFPISVNLSTINDSDGNPTEVVTVHGDITERKAAENTLRESEEKYRNIIENIQEVFYRADMEGNLVMISPSGAKQMGYDSVEDMLGLNIAKTFYAVPEERDEFLKILEEKGAVNDYEITLKKTDGTLVPVRLSSHLYFDKSGNLLGMEGFLSDITERKRAEDEIRKKTEELEGFNKLAVGREVKMIELKKEINALLWKLGEKPEYEIAGES